MAKHKNDMWWYEARKQWAADIPRVGGGRRKRVYLGPDKDKARAKFTAEMAKYYEAVANGEQSDEEDTSSDADMTVLDLTGLFMDWTKDNRSGNTLRSYRDGINHLTDHCSEMPCQALTPPILEEVKHAMQQDGLQARTINKTVVVSKRMYNWAVEQRYLGENPIAKVKEVSKYVNVPDEFQSKALTLEDALTCITLCHESPPLGDICEVLLFTGMRIGELVNLRWSDIDWNRQFVVLSKHKTFAYSGTPRLIPLADRCVEILKSRVDSESEGFVFVGEFGQQFDQNSLYKRLRRLRKKHTELEEFTFHRLRHSCASLLQQLGYPAHLVQAILGHGSRLMTQHYTTAYQPDLQDAVNGLAEAYAEQKAKVERRGKRKKKGARKARRKA